MTQINSFPFFIVEFETDGFSVHKDEMVVAAEAAFEYNRFLTAAYYLTEDEVKFISPAYWSYKWNNHSSGFDEADL